MCKPSADASILSTKHVLSGQQQHVYLLPKRLTIIGDACYKIIKKKNINNKFDNTRVISEHM